MKKKRNWPGSAVNFITAATIIAQNGRKYQSTLINEDTSFIKTYFDGVDAKIKNIKENILGVDKNANLRKDTNTLTDIQNAALNNLGNVHTIITTKINSKTRQQELLNTLGFNANYKKATKKIQQALTKLLIDFKTNLTSAIRTELETAGAPKIRIDNIISATTLFDTANTNQEGSKTARLSLTEVAIDAINDLFADIKAITKSGQRAFANDPALKALFVCSYIMKNLGDNHAPTVKKDKPAK
jgi:hypothetical protein